MIPIAAIRPKIILPRAAGGGGATTFDSTTKSSHITLDGTKLIATSGAGSGNGTDAFSVASHSTGKFYAEFTLTNKAGGAEIDAVGVVNSAYVADAVFMGNGANSAGLFDDGNMFSSAAGFTAGANGAGTFTTGDVIGLAVDVGGGLIWWRKNAGLWFGIGIAGDPVAGTNGNSISGMGTPLRAAVEGGTSGDVWTANFGGSAYSQTPPTGYGNW